MSTMTHEVVAFAFDVDSGVATLTLQRPDGVNKVDDVFTEAIDEAINETLDREGLRGVLVISSHAAFCVGADVDAIYAATDAAALLSWVRRLQQVYRRLETAGVPVVAVIDGSALGGGFELALACHYRVVLDDPHLRLGLPEVTLGLIPGSGGTQRLPRLLGFQVALPYLLEGTTLTPRQALDAGLVDELGASREELIAIARHWIVQHPTSRQPWDADGYRFPEPGPKSEAARDLFLAASAMLYKKTAGAVRAPELALCAIQEGAALRFDRSLEVEARYFVQLATSPQAKDILRTAWYHRRAAERLEGLPSTDDAELATIGIVGAGMMGSGLADACAAHGYRVALHDVSTEALSRAHAACEKLARRRAQAGGMADRVEDLLARITVGTEASVLDGCDLIIEAVFEDLALKRQVLAETEPRLSARGVWASNTSALPIGAVTGGAQKPERCLGLHFFSPVERMPLVEVVRGPHTSVATLARALAFCRRLQKLPIVVNDGFGFFTTRVFVAYILEGAQLVAEGYDPALVEWSARSAGMAVGPLQVFDEVSLALGQHIVAGVRQYLGAARLAPAGVQLVENMVEQHDRRGRAAGAGFYVYRDGKRQGLWDGLCELRSTAMVTSSPELLGQRLLLVQSVEAARALDQGIVQRPRDSELGAVFGLGFPLARGGPLSYLDQLGLPQAVELLDQLAVQHGPRFEPPALLREMGSRGERFFPVGVDASLFH